MMNRNQLEKLQPTLLERFEQTVATGRLGHAYLFSGDFGSYEMALYLSQSLFCEHVAGGRPCQTCRTCQLIAAGEFSDVTVIEPQGNFIKTDTVRELVKNFAQSGFESSRQVFIIKDAEKMHTNAANSLLKVMEEPQSDIHLFLLTNQEDAVLATIKSRAQIIPFPKNQAYLERLLEEEGLLKTQAHLLAQLSSSVGQAKQLAGNKAVLESFVFAKKFIEILLNSPEQAYLQVTKLANLVTEKADKELVMSVLTIYLSEQLANPTAMRYLESLLTARRMWQSNVSLQNALEYWVLG